MVYPIQDEKEEEDTKKSAFKSVCGTKGRFKTGIHPRIIARALRNVTPEKPTRQINGEEYLRINEFLESPLRGDDDLLFVPVAIPLIYSGF